MDSMDASVENEDQREKFEKLLQKFDMEKLESIVTPEQVLSASVARKRRKFTKKRSTSRELTPARQVSGEKASTTETDDDVRDPRPKTPERRNRKVVRSVSKHKETVENGTVSVKTENYKGGVVKSASSSDLKQNDQQQVAPPVRKKSFSDLAQAEILTLYTKAKRGVSRGRDRFRKHDKLVGKRSQSTPTQPTEQELIESFRKAQLLSFQSKPKRSSSVRKYSTDSSLRTSPERIIAKPIKPLVQPLHTASPPKKHVQASKKIIEVIDPRSFNLTFKKPPTASPMQLTHLFKVLVSYTPREIYRNYRAYKVLMKWEYDKIRSLRRKCMLELMLIMIYCGLGGVMFKFVEGAFENFYKCGVKRVKRDFIDTLWYRSHNMREEEWKSLARNKLRTFEDELHQAHEAGVHSYSGQRSWSFLNGVVYALTIVTTIGYGHMYPTTITGRALTIVYSIIGIPLFLIALTDFGKLFTRCIKFVWSFVRRLYYTGSCRQVRKTAHVHEIFKGAQMMYEIATFRRPSHIDPEALNNIQQNINPTTTDIGNDTPTTPAPSNFEIDDEFNLPISLAIFILILYIFMGALIYCMWEGWDFFASFYFVFISMSTIGFGDYVPKHPICMLVSIVYLVFGLALMSMCINVVQAKLSDTFKHASVKIGATIGLTVTEDDGAIEIVPPAGVEMPEVHEGSNVNKEDADNNENGNDGLAQNASTNEEHLIVPAGKDHLPSN